jgi:hypothetical protein
MNAVRQVVDVGSDQRERPDPSVRHPVRWRESRFAVRRHTNAGLITDKRLKISYHGARTVTGGTPFCFK